MRFQSIAVPAAVLIVHVAAVGQDVDYGRDIRPILSRHCFQCHGPDELTREAGLRLDLHEAAVGPADSGRRAITPGNPDSSELVRRVESKDPDLQMPPPSTKRTLTAVEKDLLRRWIQSGAGYTVHWSFVKPVRPTIPDVRQGNWSRDGLDAFVLARIEREGLKPSPDADRYSLIRRVSLDLTGLPPSPEEADEFCADTSPDAFERLVDRLLASPHYGERWARRWLDLARYADTNGYEKDRVRSIWPYRDWVISALNANLPFDQFTVEQLAGDMLPGATVTQQIATGFHRNTMLNEEGGIDPLEFRFYAMTDRVATTGTVWLGLTIACAQCHSHKYDPISQTDYYRLFALLNNAEEPEIDVVRDEIAAHRARLKKQITALEADLPQQFPLPDEFEWTSLSPAQVRAEPGTEFQVLDDHSILVTGANPETASYEWTAESELGDVAAIRLEALSDSRLPSKGPGRTPHGNFVLTEFRVQSGESSATLTDLRLTHARADFSQNQFPVEKSIDGDRKAGGWAIHGPDPWNVNRTAIYVLEQPVAAGTRRTWRIVMDQQFGKQHTLGRFRISLGRRRPQSGSDAERRAAHREQRFAEWVAREQEQAVTWTALTPVRATSNLPRLTIQPDKSIVASGDMSKRDVYDVACAVPADARSGDRPWTALRIEAIPDDQFPRRGPGRVYYEGPLGDFFLSELTVQAQGMPVPLAGATQSFASGGNTAQAALDGNLQTGWSIQGGQGRTQVAVFPFQKPVSRDAVFELALVFERYYAAGLGRFRIWVTDDPRPVKASSLPLDLEPVLLARRSGVPVSDEAQTRLLQYFCQVAPELESARQAIKTLESQMLAFPTTLVMKERPADFPRQTHRYHRGEFLQPRETVEPASLSSLPPLPADQPPNRLTLARWLVSSDNPLGARVTANREWAALFGRGLVRTIEDFGSQGANPSHPELLDFLAVELQGRDVPATPRWDLKRFHRRLVGSATYRQSSEVTSELRTRDAANQWLARGPRQRLEAEVLRDAALRVSGLLSEKMLGPSVFPPQPPGVTTEGTYGGLAWNVSPGEDRYRRTLYTFSKRTAPYALSLTFDGPSGEACIARREVTNTPLQALSLMNDPVFLDAARALGREFAAAPGTVEQRIAQLFRRCVVRPPRPEEIQSLQRFQERQRARLTSGELNGQAIAGDGATRDAAEWTLLARLLLNLDETIMND